MQKNKFYHRQMSNSLFSLHAWSVQLSCNLRKQYRLGFSEL